MPKLTPLTSQPQQEPSQELAEFKATLEQAIAKNASVIENTHFTLRGIAELLDISKDLWEFYRYHAQGIKLSNEQLEVLKKEINTLSTHINQTLENLNDTKRAGDLLFELVKQKLGEAKELATQSQADMQEARTALATIKTLETRLPEIQTQLESLTQGITQAIEKKQELEAMAASLQVEITTALETKKSELETQLTEKKSELESTLSTLAEQAEQAKTQAETHAATASTKASETSQKAQEIIERQQSIQTEIAQAQELARESIAQTEDAKTQAINGIEGYKESFLSNIGDAFSSLMAGFYPAHRLHLQALNARLNIAEQILFGGFNLVTSYQTELFTQSGTLYKPPHCPKGFVVVYGGHSTGARTQDSDIGFMGISAGIDEVRWGEVQFNASSEYEVDIPQSARRAESFVLVICLITQPDDGMIGLPNFAYTQLGITPTGAYYYAELPNASIETLNDLTTTENQELMSGFAHTDFSTLDSFYRKRMAYSNKQKQVLRNNGVEIPERFDIDINDYDENIAGDKGMLAIFIYLHNQSSPQELFTQRSLMQIAQVTKLAHFHKASEQVAASFSSDDLSRLDSYFDTLGQMYRGGFRESESARRENLSFYLTNMAYAQGQTARDPRDQFGWILGEVYRNLGRQNVANALRYTQASKFVANELPQERNTQKLREYIITCIDSDEASRAEQRANEVTRGLQDQYARGIFEVIERVKNAFDNLNPIAWGENPPVQEQEWSSGWGSTQEYEEIDPSFP